MLVISMLIILFNLMLLLLLCKVMVPVVLSQYYRNLGPTTSTGSTTDTSASATSTSTTSTSTTPTTITTTASRSFDYFDAKMELQRGHRFMFDRHYAVTLRHPPSEVYYLYINIIFSLYNASSLFNIDIYIHVYSVCIYYISASAVCSALGVRRRHRIGTRAIKGE